MSSSSVVRALGGSLEQLLGSARALPGERSGARPLAYLHPLLQSNPAPPFPTAAVLPPAVLRQKLSLLMATLAQRLEPALTTALRQAEVAWDSFDTLSVLDAELDAEAQLIADGAARLGTMPEAAQRAAGLELRLALAATLGLVQLCERRLATLVRLRVQSAEPSLLPGGRPFLDVAAALAEAARGLA